MAESYAVTMMAENHTNVVEIRNTNQPFLS